MRILAIDIGGTKFTVAGFEDEALILRESRVTDREGGPDWMCSQIEQVLASWRFKPDRCGIGFGGPVDFPTQTVTLSTHVSGWAGYPLIERIQRMTGAPAVMDNDANTGALGEARYGAGIGADPLFYMTLSTGIGGGIVTNGQIHRGADSYAGEIGHLNIEPDGPDCLCGSRGCYERMCCGLWLERDYGKSAKELLTDPRFVEKYVIHLARGLKAALMLLNPARIVIGGGISKAGDALFVPLRTELGHQMTAWSRARRDVVPAALGDDSVLWGALALARM
jgi:glucokinase